MAQCRFGTLHFTFEDNTEEMVVHLFRIYIRFVDESHYDGRNNLEMNVDDSMVFNVPSRSMIRDCDEIAPIWYDDYTTIPLNNMFADDSIWLTYLLVCSRQRETQLEAWFHFKAGGQETNTILCYYINNIEISKETGLNYRDINSLVPNTNGLV